MMYKIAIKMYEPYKDWGGVIRLVRNSMRGMFKVLLLICSKKKKKTKEKKRKQRKKGRDYNL